jgi:hypothetical protein
MMEAAEHDELALDDEDDATITNITEQLQSLRAFHLLKVLC